MSYEYFPHFYDELMESEIYDKWVAFVAPFLVEKEGKLLDIACGTGEFMIHMYLAGFKVFGIDLSAEMVSIAQNKVQKISLPIKVYKADMTNFHLNEQFEVITCFCDSLNYLETKQQVVATFKKVYKHLAPGGIFIFDVHSVYKMDKIFPRYVYGDNDDFISTIWRSFKNESFPHAVDHELTFFIQDESGLYMRKDEVHKQRTYPASFYEQKLKETKFRHLEVFADFLYEKPKKNSERLFFVARK